MGQKVGVCCRLLVVIRSPLKEMSNPKALVNESRPRRSTRTIDVKEMNAETETPRHNDSNKKLIRSSQKGKETRQRPLSNNDTLVTSSELTCGRSTNQPTATLELQRIG